MKKRNLKLSGTDPFRNPKDIVYTPAWLAYQILEMFPLEGKILEPCIGDGAFLQFIPSPYEWCEITLGKNFYSYTEKVDWIVTNPPFSDFERFLAHSLEVADNIVFLIPISKLFSNLGRLKTIENYGGIVSIHYLGGSKANFPSGFPAGICYLKKGYDGPTEIKKLPLKEYTLPLQLWAPLGNYSFTYYNAPIDDKFYV
jgi:hypothetical protein